MLNFEERVQVLGPSHPPASLNDQVYKQYNDKPSETLTNDPHLHKFAAQTMLTTVIQGWKMQFEMLCYAFGFYSNTNQIFDIASNRASLAQLTQLINS